MWEERRIDTASLKALAEFLPKFEAPDSDLVTGSQGGSV